MSTFWIALLLAQISVVLGAAFRDSLKTMTVHGITVKYCEYNGRIHYPPSNFNDYATCNECSCTNSGLSCQTMSGAERITVPRSSPCVSVLIRCKNVWVLRNRQTTACPSHLIPTNVSMVGK